MKINFLKEEYIECVWPGAVLPLGENGQYLVNFFKEHYDINIQYVDETRTLPGYGPKGGRIDQIFNVNLDSVDKFDNIKQKIGAEYAKDIVRKGGHRFYKQTIFVRYFERLEKELLEAGEIQKEDVYQRKF